MKVMCMCGRENHTEMPFDDMSTVRIACTSACKAAKLDKIGPQPRQAEAFPRPSFGSLRHEVPFTTRR